MAKKGSETSRPSSAMSEPTPFQREFPQGSESANAAMIAFVRTHDALLLLLNEMLPEYGVSQAGRQLLAVLEGAGTPLSPTVIADRLLVTTASMTSLLDTLEKRKLVTRTPDPDDRRRVLVTITPAGKKLVDKMLPEVVAVQTALFADISEADRKKFMVTLQRLRETAAELDVTAIRKAAPPRGPRREA